MSYNKKDEAKEGVIDDLNKTVKGLRNEVSELEVKLKLVTWKKFLLESSIPFRETKNLKRLRRKMKG